MKLLLVDDEDNALAYLEKCVRAVCPEAEVFAFKKPNEALISANSNIFDIAFLDIKLFGMSGVALGKKLKDITPEVNLVFCTAYSEYAIEAFRMHASGYLLKPFSEEDIRRELEAPRRPIEAVRKSHIYIQTFGNFDVFYDGKPVEFTRSKSKETLAYLVDRCGTSVTTAEIAAILYGDDSLDEVKQNQIRTYIYDLRKSLKRINAEDILVKCGAGLMLDKSKVDCDFFRLMNGDAAAMNQYRGRYMENYSWAELTVGFLDRLYSK